MRKKVKKRRKYKHKDTDDQAWTRISEISEHLRENKNRDTNNPMDDEFGFNYNMPQPQKKKKKKANRKRNPYMIGSVARPWKGIFGLKKWLMK